MGRIIDRRRVMGVGGNPFIQFADPTTKSLCVALWGGADGGTAPLNTRVNNVKVSGVDGELTYKQAASILAVSNAQFKNSNIGSFDELQYFTELTTVGNESFRSCAKMTSVIIPDNVVEIGISAFDGNRKLSYVLIGNNVKSIGSYAFWNCTFTSINIPNSVTEISTGAFQLCARLVSVTLPNSITIIKSSVFDSCTSLTSITIPNSVTSIGNWAFQNCSALTSITIPNSVTSIGNYAFSGCSGLTSIEIPNSVTSIGNYAFSGCSSLTSVTIPNSVTTIGNNPFRSCGRITSITVENGNTVYDSRDNCNAIIETSTNKLVSGCKNTVIPNSVTSIGEYAFWHIETFTSITIPNSVTSIMLSAFDGCTGLVGNITIPDSVTTIGNFVFWGCNKVSSFTFLSIVPPTLGTNVFKNTSSNLIIYVPAESVEAYKAASNWSAYADKIQAIPT